MKIRSFLIVTASLVTLFTASAQSSEKLEKVEHVPNSITWNLHREQRERFESKIMYKDTYTPSEEVWKSPSDGNMTVELHFFKPKFTENFTVEKFLDEKKNEGYMLCPEWVPISLYLYTSTFSETLWLPTEKCMVGHRLSEIPRLGRPGSQAFTSSVNSKDPELSLDNPSKSKYGDVWVLCKYSK